jgi:hypothetical protein
MHHLFLYVFEPTPSHTTCQCLSLAQFMRPRNQARAMIKLMHHAYLSSLLQAVLS